MASSSSITDTFMMSMMDDEDQPQATPQSWNHAHSPSTGGEEAATGGLPHNNGSNHEEEDEEKYRQSIRLAKGLAAHNMKPLPETYVLGEHDVICGRGRRCFNHIGNQRFRKMVEESLSKYAEATAKLEKTYIICEVVNQVRKNSPEGGFVKKDPVNGRYFEVGDFLAREKTSQAFRDALHDQYKSSNAAKKKRRIKEQAVKLHKQSSAPLLSVSAIQGSTEDINAESRFEQAHNYNLTDYAVNNSKWMRVETPQERMSFAMGEAKEQNMDLLLGELNLNSSSHGQQQQTSHMDKRRMFASQKSATSVVDDVTSSGQPAWFNRSCPNLAVGQNQKQQSQQRHDQLMHDVIQESDEETSMHDMYSRSVFNDWHHSTPDLFGEPQMPPDQVHSDPKPSLLLNRMMKKARSERHLMNTGIANRFDMFEQPQKSACTTQATINHEDLVLSPIGDGSALDLFEKLQNIEEHCASFLNPLPY